MPRLRSRRRAAPDYRFDRWGVASPEHRNGDEAQLCNGRALAADGAASKQLDACKHQSDRSSHPLMLGTHVRASSGRAAAVILTSWSVSRSRAQRSGLMLGGDHEPARRSHGADAHRDRFEHAAAQQLPGAAGEVHDRHGREPVADRPAPLQGHHGAGELRRQEGGVELLRDLVEQRAVGGLVEEDLAQAAELGGNNFGSSTWSERSAGGRSHLVEQVQQLLGRARAQHGRRVPRGMREERLRLALV
jgi:hypothetical protein